ncbi:MAG TPA: DUF465 domain-containing protein [Sulfurovum sp.]|nr:DUF465 domain-containing protein [Sulfurovum sp.]
MLHEYRDEIHELKLANAHFAKIFEQHNELDQKIEDAVSNRIILTDQEVEVLKKEKLRLKDEALKIILNYRKMLGLSSEIDSKIQV